MTFLKNSNDSPVSRHNVKEVIKMFLLAFYFFFPFWTSQYKKEIDENIRNVNLIKSSNTMTI